MSRLRADPAYRRLRHSRGFDLSNCRCGMIYEVLISKSLPGRLDLRGFDLRKDNIYTIYIMYIRGFDFQHHKIRRLYARGFDLSDSVAQGADSRGLYLSPMRGTSKTRSKPRKWVTLEEDGGGHQM